MEKTYENNNFNEKFRIKRIEDFDEIKDIIYDFDKVFKPTLSERLDDLELYSEKIYNNANVFVVEENNDYIGLLVFYTNNVNHGVAFLSQIGVKHKAQNRKIGTLLLELCIDISRCNGMSKLKLEVDALNFKAIKLYKKYGFKFCCEISTETVYMIKNL